MTSQMTYQELIDEVFRKGKATEGNSIPVALLELIGPWLDGWDVSLAAWEAAGEPFNSIKAKIRFTS